MSRSRFSITLLTVLAFAAACSPDAAAPATTDRPRPTAASTSAPTAVPETSTTLTTSTTSTAPTPSTTSTTLPPVLVVEQVARINGRAIDPAVHDGGSYVGRAESDSAPLATRNALIRLEETGAIVQDVPVVGVLSIFDVVSVAGRWFAFTFDGTTCGVGEFDRTTLALGAPAAFPTDRGCGGSLADDGASIYATDVGSPDVFRLDLASGAATRITLAGAVPDGYDSADVIPLAGHLYVMLLAGFDATTGETNRGPDGSALPPLLARVDGGTGAVTWSAVAGWVELAGGQLTSRLGGGRVQVIDPTTLAGTEVAETDVPLPDDEFGISDAGDVGWTFWIDDGVLTVAQHDPASGVVLREASVDTGTAGLAMTWTGFVTDEGYIVFGADHGEYDGSAPMATLMFRAALTPAGQG